MHKSWRALALSVVAAIGFADAARVIPADRAPMAPAFEIGDPARWLNGPPIALSDLRGKIVLVDFWTFDCWNCNRSIPWLNALEARFPAADFQIVGVHTPEFEHEKIPAKVRAKLAQYQIRHPVVMDNDMRIWHAWGNRYWPAFYLIDRAGRLRAYYAGETHAADAQAVAVEAAIETLLREPADNAP